jgi:hypothetical protein
LNSLPPREVRILQLRYGLLDGQAYTLEEVGRKMGVTRERVRQIEPRRSAGCAIPQSAVVCVITWVNTAISHQKERINLCAPFLLNFSCINLSFGGIGYWEEMFL